MVRTSKSVIVIEIVLHFTRRIRGRSLLVECRKVREPVNKSLRYYPLSF